MINMGSKDDDNIRRLLCERYPGGRSVAYDKWEEHLLDAFAGKGDEDASWADTVTRQDNVVGLTPAQARRRAP